MLMMPAIQLLRQGGKLCSATGKSCPTAEACKLVQYGKIF